MLYVYICGETSSMDSFRATSYKMFHKILFLFLYILHTSYGDWISDWMGPVRDQIIEGPSRKFDIVEDQQKPVEGSMMTAPVQQPREFPEPPPVLGMPYGLPSKRLAVRDEATEYNSATNMRVKLEATLKTAEGLIETLKAQILAVSTREYLLKEAITNGRSGVTTVTVTSLGQLPRTYIIRDGFWTFCNGVLQFPNNRNPAGFILMDANNNMPRCIGTEVSSTQDPCAFNSVIKYETIPTRRAAEYAEEDFLCLKPGFRNTLEQYLSVPKHVINETCLQGVVWSLKDFNSNCGVRTMTEYTYYPLKGSPAAALPLDYCAEPDGGCKMIVAWHVSNASIENFEFLKDETDFKKYFIKPGAFMERV